MKRLSLMIMFTLTGCTLSFQNINTIGTASDLVDETQEASPPVTVNAPVSLVPK